MFNVRTDIQRKTRLCVSSQFSAQEAITMIYFVRLTLLIYIRLNNKVIMYED